MLEHFRRLLDPSLLLLVAVFAVGLRFAMAAGLFGLPLALIIVSWHTKYAYALLEDVAHGITTPRTLSLEMVNPVEQRPLVQLGICGLCVLAVRAAGGTAGLVLGVAFALLLPASVAILAAAGSMWEAINPLALLRVINALGRLYILVLTVAGICGAGAWALNAADAPLVVQFAFALFALLALFNVIGGALYERRSVLDIATVRSPEQRMEREAQSQAKERSRRLDELYVCVRARKYAETEAMLARWLPAATGPELSEDSHALIAAARSWGDPRTLSIVAEAVITRLHAARLDMDALEAYAAILTDASAAASSVPATDSIALAELAAAAGRRSLARSILDTIVTAHLDDYLAKRLARLRTSLAR